MLPRFCMLAALGVGLLLSPETTTYAAQDEKTPPNKEKTQPPTTKPSQPVAQPPSEPATAEVVKSPAAKKPSPRPTAQRRAPATVIREPSQGRPIFITPGETFSFVMSLPAEFKGDVGFILQHALEPSVRIPVKPTTPPAYFNEEYCMLVLQVGAKVEPGLYDLEVRTEVGAYRAPHSIKVVNAFKSKFRFVHLSNMNVGDLTAPEFDEMLPKEINLLAPEFIIATGDYTEWSRARDDATSWKRVLTFLEKFSAPVYMLCGGHDHEASFTDFVASRPIGTIDYGDYHVLLLLDHPGNPIDQDYSQIRWIEADLKRNRDKRINFIATNSDEMGLLDVWRQRGNIEQYVKDHNIRMMLAGGSADWDYKEFADKLRGLDEFHYVRTHQSSTCMRGRATGFSHYRVIEVDGDALSYVYSNDSAAERLQHSIPTGRLRAFFDAPNNGKSRRVGVTVQNALNQRFDGAKVWLRVAKNGRTQPSVAPGELLRVLDAGKHWACEVAFDLPEKGAVKIVAAAAPEDIPPPLPVVATLSGPRDWTFAAKSTDFGMSYFDCEAEVALELTNPGASPRTVWPVVRVNGSQVHLDRTVAPRLPLTLKAGETLSIPLALSLRRVSPGPHTVQVHFLEDPLCRLQTFDVTLAHQGIASSGDLDAP